MKRKNLGLVVMMMMAAFTIAACRGNERATLTGGYGSGVVSGQVVMAEGGSPAGVEISVRGSGQSVTVGADGRFAFAGLSENITLDFRRADGVDTSLRLDQSGEHTIALTQTTAKKTSGRRRSIGGGGTKVQQFEGLIRTAAAEQIVVYTSHKEEVTIALGAQTVIRKGNTTLTAADLTADMRVHVKAQQTDGKWTALLVIVQNDGSEDDDGEEDAPAVREYEGTVVRASATELVIIDSHKREVTFAINGETVIRKGNTPVLPADILAGTRVHVKATGAADGARTAVQITVQNTTIHVSITGTVSAVSGSGLTVSSDGTTYTVQTNGSTQIREKGKKVSLSSITAGDTVKVEGTKTAATTILAKSIEVKSE
jgi:hypothetical protein